MVLKWPRSGCVQGATYFFRNRYDSGMDTEKRELWDRLENEPERAYRAFECFLSLPGGERTLLEAYRRHVGNPDAAKPSDTWSGWSSSLRLARAGGGLRRPPRERAARGLRAGDRGRGRAASS